MRDRHHAHHCASEISPRAAEVPSSTQSAPYVSPVGINQEAHRIDSRIPLGPRTPSSRAPDMYPHGMPNIPNGGGTSPRISPSPLAGLLMAPLSVSSRGGSRPLNRWGQAAFTSFVSCDDLVLTRRPSGRPSSTYRLPTFTYRQSSTDRPVAVRGHHAHQYSAASLLWCSFNSASTGRTAMPHPQSIRAAAVGD